MKSTDDHVTILSATKRQYLSAGIYYYATGRFAFFGGMVPVMGNLFHHSVEMLLKGALCDKLSTMELKNHLHNLPQIWNEFRTTYRQRALSKLERIVRDVHKFEDLRYPDKAPGRGYMSYAMRTHGKTPSTYILGRKPRPVYRVILSDVDDLVAFIFKAIDVRPGPPNIYLNQEALDCLKRDNAAGLFI